MKGIRFYEELENKGKKNETSKGNVIAVQKEYPFLSRGELAYECVGAVFYEANSEVSGSSCTAVYLAEHTKRISEARAREIHPKLFEYLANC